MIPTQKITLVETNSKGDPLHLDEDDLGPAFRRTDEASHCRKETVVKKNEPKTTEKHTKAFWALQVARVLLQLLQLLAQFLRPMP